MDIRNPGLHGASKAFVERALALLRQEFPSGPGSMTRLMPRWRRDSDAFFVRDDEPVPTTGIELARLRDRLARLPEYSALVEAFQGDATLSRLVGQLVGTALFRRQFAVDAAHFGAEHAFTRKQRYALIRNAYRYRSGVVHGGSPPKCELPDGSVASLDQFTSVAEDYMRAKLKHAACLVAEGQKLDAACWDGLILP